MAIMILLEDIAAPTGDSMDSSSNYQVVRGSSNIVLSPPAMLL